MMKKSGRIPDNENPGLESLDSADVTDKYALHFHFKWRILK